MGRRAAERLPLSDGTILSVGFKNREGMIRCRFVGPDGKPVEKSTGLRAGAWKPGKSVPVDAIQAAAKIVARAYEATLPAERRKADWDRALADLDRTPDLRPDSIRGYRTAVAALRATVPGLAGPGAVTAEIAERFKRDFLAGTYRRGKTADARRYKRSPESCKTYLRSLRSLWEKHFKPFVAGNPWLDVPYPNTPRGRRVRVPAEDAVKAFFVWLEAKHPGWELPRLFVTVKMLAGCRTIDLAKARTADLGADSLTLTAEATKTREARTLPLPADVVADLRQLAGPVWLWERSVEESKRFRPNPKTRSRTGYDPSTWRWTVQNLFREFNADRPAKSRLRPHDLRARAFTLVAAATGSVDATAHAMGADPQTARHYMDAAKVFSREDVLRKAADLLRPK